MGRKRRKQSRDDIFGGLPTPKARPSGFDSAFGLDFDFGSKLDSPQNENKLFQDFGFTDEFNNSQSEEAFNDNDPEVPEAISNNFDEPDERMFRPEAVGELSLFEQLPKVRLGTPIPKSDPELPRNQKIERKFLRVRQEALETGGNPLTPEEEDQFKQVGPTRNFGTTGRRATGLGFGRF